MLAMSSAAESACIGGVHYTYMTITGTFMAANSISTLCEEVNISEILPKLLGTTAVNLPGCILKVFHILIDV